MHIRISLTSRAPKPRSCAGLSLPSRWLGHRGRRVVAGNLTVEALFVPVFCLAELRQGLNQDAKGHTIGLQKLLGRSLGHRRPHEPRPTLPLIHLIQWETCTRRHLQGASYTIHSLRNAVPYIRLIDHVYRSRNTSMVQLLLFLALARCALLLLQAIIYLVLYSILRGVLDRLLGRCHLIRILSGLLILILIGVLLLLV